MKKSYLYSLILLILVSVAAFGQKSFDITISVSNVKNTNGQVRLALFDKAEHFPKDGKEYKMGAAKARKDFSYTFKDIPQGNYAIAVLHDENNNGKCEMNILGMPKEGYGFSNNVKPKFSAPSFSQAQFTLTQPMTQRISLIY